MSATSINIVLIVLVVLTLVANVYFRFRRAAKSPLGLVTSLILEMNRNQKTVAGFSYHWRGKRLKTASWKGNKDRIDFLPIEIRTMLSEVYGLVEEANERIDAAKKYKTDSYMAGIDVGKLREPLVKGMQELQQWLQANMNDPQYAPRRRGLFGF